MKEVTPRKAIFLAGVLTLNACGEQITEGIVYKKDHTEQHPFLMPQMIGGEILNISQVRPRWEVTIAKCLTETLPPKERIEKECKTSSMEVTEKRFNKVRIGQKLNFDSIAWGLETPR